MALIFCNKKNTDYNIVMIETMLTLNSWIALGVLIFEIAVLGKLFALIIMSFGDDNNFKKNFQETVYGTKHYN
jgi:hypothetical protein